MTISTFLVGGCVRDYYFSKHYGVEKDIKDFDFAVEADSFDAMRQYLVENNFDIFLETPQYLTIRARAPKIGWKFADFEFGNQTFDFTLCREEREYTDGRRPDKVKPSDLRSDLARRDFTINAMALDKDGTLIDPYNGLQDLKDGIIRCVGGLDRLAEDGLRILRAMRFKITFRGFSFDSDLRYALYAETTSSYLDNISEDRIREELTKCFKADTIETLNFLSEYDELKEKIFSSETLWLRPTSEKK